MALPLLEWCPSLSFLGLFASIRACMQVSMIAGTQDCARHMQLCSHWSSCLEQFTSKSLRCARFFAYFCRDTKDIRV